MAEIKQTQRAARGLRLAMEYCRKDRHEFVTPEHLLEAMLEDNSFSRTLNQFYSPEILAVQLYQKMKELETVPEGNEYEPEASEQLGQVVA